MKCEKYAKYAFPFQKIIKNISEAALYNMLVKIQHEKKNKK